MRRYFALVRLMLLQQYKARTVIKTKKKGRRAGTVLIALLLLVGFGPMLASFALLSYTMGTILQGDVHFAALLMLICQCLVLVFGLHDIMANVFLASDGDKLLYLPVRSPVIFLARLTVVYLNELITTCISSLVLLLPYIIGSGAGAGAYLMLPIAILLLPLLPMLTCAIICLPVSALINLLGKNNVLKTVLRTILQIVIIALVVLVAGFTGYGSVDFDEILQDPTSSQAFEGFIDQLRHTVPYFHSDYMLSKGMFADGAGQWLGGFGASFGENALLLSLTVLVSLPFYHRMLTGTADSGRTRRKHRTEQYSVKPVGVVRQFMVTEVKRLMRDAQKGFQSLAGMIMMPFIVVLFAVMLGVLQPGGVSILDEFAAAPLYNVLAPVVIVVYLSILGISSNYLGIYPISRENKTLPLLKSLPVPFSKILLAKVLLATSSMLIADFVTVALTVALLRVKWYWGLAMLATMVFAGFGSMCLTTLRDLRSPLLGSDGLTRQNTRASLSLMLISLCVGMALALLAAPFIVLYALVGGWYWTLLMWLVEIAATCAFAALGYKFMKDRAAFYFQRIEA